MHTNVPDSSIVHIVTHSVPAEHWLAKNINNGYERKKLQDIQQEREVAIFKQVFFK